MIDLITVQNLLEFVLFLVKTPDGTFLFLTWRFYQISLNFSPTSKWKLKNQMKNFIWQQYTCIEISESKLGWLLNSWSKEDAPPFLQVRRRNRGGDNKNLYYNIDMAFFIQENVNFYLSKLTQLTKKSVFPMFFYKELLCFDKWSSCFTLMTVSDFDIVSDSDPKLKSIYSSAISATAF